MQKITPEIIEGEILKKKKDIVERHSNTDEILCQMLSIIEPVDFFQETHTPECEKIKSPAYIIACVDVLMRISRKHNWDLRSTNQTVYLFNGSLWQPLSKNTFQKFLISAAIRMGAPGSLVRYHKGADDLLKQFIITADSMEETAGKEKDVFLMNLQNGTYEISSKGSHLRAFKKEDGLTYQLPFGYDPDAKCPRFMAMLNHNLPDHTCQDVLAEYIASIFAPQIKLEKCLVLFGSGANGKSVVFEIVNALLGEQNVSSYTLRNLTGKEGYQRAELADKLLNYTTEINPRQIDTGMFKSLVSREPVEARRIYGRAFTIRNYAKLMFNCNILPEGNEINEAYYRRFCIIPFNVMIPEKEQDPSLATKIISTELPGIFNWVLDGLKRFIANERLSDSPSINDALIAYREQSDSVALFLEEIGYQPGNTSNLLLSVIYQEYNKYCNRCNLPSISMKAFSDALVAKRFFKKRTNRGVYVTFSKI